MSNEFIEKFEMSKSLPPAPAAAVPDKNYELELTKKFIARYKSTFESINSKLQSAYHDDKGYHIPVPSLLISEGTGFTEYNNTQSAFALNPPSKMGVKIAVHEEIQYVLRIAIAYAQADEVLNNESFFNEYFDTLVNSAYNETVKRYGNPKYGRAILDYTRPGTNLIFTTLSDGTGVELRFNGSIPGKVL